MQVEGRRKAQPGPGGRAVRMPGGYLVTRRVASEQTGGAHSSFEVRPRGAEPPHVQHRDDECIRVPEGRFEAGPGGVIYAPKNALHAFENVGDATGKLLVVHTPGRTGVSSGVRARPRTVWVTPRRRGRIPKRSPCSRQNTK